MTDKEIVAFIEQEAIRPGEISQEELREERAIMQQVKSLGIPKHRSAVVEKKYKFCCPKCGETCMVIPENELLHYFRVWELLENKPLTDTQIVEFVDLCGQGYRFIGLLCSNEKCDGEFDAIIMNKWEWEEHVERAEIAYEFPKISDLA